MNIEPMIFITVHYDNTSYMINVKHIVSVTIDDKSQEVIKITTVDKDEFNCLHIPVADFYKAMGLKEE